jgi:hypothetical protein
MRLWINMNLPIKKSRKSGAMLGREPKSKAGRSCSLMMNKSMMTNKLKKITKARKNPKNNKRAKNKSYKRSHSPSNS